MTWDKNKASRILLNTDNFSGNLSGTDSDVQKALETLDQLSAGSVADSEIWLHTGNGYGSVNNKIRRFTTVGRNNGSDMTLAQSAENGDSITINTTGRYAITYTEMLTSGAVFSFGLSRNSSELTTAIATITATDRIAYITHTADWATTLSATLKLTANDVIRPHTDGNGESTAARVQFRIIFLGS